VAAAFGPGPSSKRRQSLRNGPTHVPGIGIDVTSLKRTEQSLQEAKAELDRIRLEQESEAQSIWRSIEW